MTGFPLDNSFRPRRWLRGQHFQTIMPNWPWRRARVERRALPMRAASEELLLDCGDGITLQSFHASPAKRGREPGKRLAVLLHGWEGSADSTYMLSLAQSLFAANYEVVRLNLRDHGATPVSPPAAAVPGVVPGTVPQDVTIPSAASAAQTPLPSSDRAPAQ